ncbi:MAG: lamin tail domain-containing protein, partial [Planctomycetaceae bacterium]|nr:lamin tail domain-containing protein [Planctomycetaceae bacterium]
MPVLRATSLLIATILATVCISRAEPAYISELVASNSGHFLDGDGNASDWIEIHNPNPSPLNISGYHLTDDPLQPGKWSFPQGTVMPAGEYLVIIASGQQQADHLDAEDYLHTNFSLNDSGEYLALVAADAVTVIDEFAPRFPPIPEDVS